jgi:hypothetical protein
VGFAGVRFAGSHGKKKGVGMAGKAPERVKTALRATTSLSPEAALDIVRAASGQVKGGGKSLATVGLVGGVEALANVGATVHVEEETANSLGLSITSGKRVAELCTFTAHADSVDGKTELRVGGLATFKATQSALLGFIPVGPKVIHGFDLYKRLLSAIEASVKAQDPAASIAIGIPGV